MRTYMWPDLGKPTFWHKQTFWENSIENFKGFAPMDKASIKPSYCEVSHTSFYWDMEDYIIIRLTNESKR